MPINSIIGDSDYIISATDYIITTTDFIITATDYVSIRPSTSSSNYMCSLSLFRKNKKKDSDEKS